MRMGGSVQLLHDTLMDFRARHGWGRAIAAPQIGVLKRIVYLHIERPWLIINPTLVGMSKATMELWDDCMSFPDLLVRVIRRCSFTLAYLDRYDCHDAGIGASNVRRRP
jgi:peptide deformylase